MADVAHKNPVGFCVAFSRLLCVALLPDLLQVSVFGFLYDIR